MSETQPRIAQITWHISSNNWADGCEMSGIDEVASFDAYLDALEAALVRDYPGVEVDVWSQAGELENELNLGYSEGLSQVDEWIASQSDRATIGLIGVDVWERGEFWVLTSEMLDQLASAPLL